MMIPLWVVVTIAYIVISWMIVLSAGKESGYGAGIGHLIILMFVTICYLIFWIVYLSVT